MTEGIPWVFVSLHDNQLCLELMEGSLGILDLLNEGCRVGESCWEQAAVTTQSPSTALSDLFALQMPQGSDEGWAQKLYQTHLSISHFQKCERLVDAFIVSHFAGKVGNAVGGVG